MSQVKTTGPQLDQGPWGAGNRKANGSHLSPAKDVVKRGPTGSHMDQYRGNRSRSSAGGAATGNPVKMAGPVQGRPERTAVRGGGGLAGHSRNKVNARASGSPTAQNPNVTK